MRSIVTSYLLQTGKCSLPYIGVFNTRYKPAVNNIADRRILPPEEKIIFSEAAAAITPELVKYTALKKNIPESEAAARLDDFCKEWKEKIESGDTLFFDSIGSLKKNKSGHLIFSAEAGNSYNIPAVAEPVLYQRTEHPVPGHETDFAADISNSSVPKIKKRSWLAGAAALFILALLILLYSFHSLGFSPSSVGNRNNITIKNARETHAELSK